MSFVLFIDSLILLLHHIHHTRIVWHLCWTCNRNCCHILDCRLVAYRARNPMAYWFGCAVIGIAGLFFSSMLCILLSASSQEMLYFCCGYSFSVGQCLVLSDALCLIFTRFTKTPILVMEQAYLHLRWRLGDAGCLPTRYGCSRYSTKFTQS